MYFKQWDSCLAMLISFYRPLLIALPYLAVVPVAVALTRVEGAFASLFCYAAMQFGRGWAEPNIYGTIKDEGSSLTQRATLNFTGPGVSCADNSGATRTDCTVGLNQVQTYSLGRALSEG